MKIDTTVANNNNQGTGDINYLKTELQRFKKLAVQEIPLDLIDIENNVRTEYDDKSIKELAESIRDDGQLNPVQISENGTRYIIRMGHRRLFAVKLLGYKTIKAVILDVTDEKEIHKLQLIENIQREDLTPHDLEISVQKLVDDGFSHDEIAKLLKKSKSWVSKTLAAKEIREENKELLTDAGVANTLSSNTLSVLTNLTDNQKKKIFSNLLQEGVPLTQAAVKKEKQKIKNPDKSTTPELSIKIQYTDMQLTASIKYSDTFPLEDKEKIIAALKQFNIVIK